MILAQLLSFSFARAANRAGIACISNVNEIRSDQANISSASSVRILLIIRAILTILHLGLNGHDLLLALRRKQQLIHLEKGLLQSHLIIFILEVFVTLQLLHEMPLHKGRNLRAWIRTSITTVAIEYSKEIGFLIR